MKRVYEAEKQYKCSAAKAVEKFFKIHSEKAFEWKDQFEWMAENHVEHFIDDTWANGTKNEDWWYSLWLIEEDGCTYIAIIERA